MYDLQFLISLLMFMVAGFVGFMLRLALESWRDFCIAKALHEAGLEQTQTARRYRRAERHKKRIPREVLTKFQEALKRKKKAVMVCESGRWRNAA